MKGLRIAHVAPCYWPAIEFGGPVRSIANLARAQTELGHEVVVHTTNLRGAVEESPVSPGWHDVDGVRVHYAQGMVPRSYFTAPGLPGALFRTLSADIDIVHLHGLWVFTTLIGARLSEVMRVPFVVAPRGSLNRWARSHKQWKKLAYLRLVEQRTLERAAAIHFTTSAERDEFDSPLPSVVVPNAIGLEGLLGIAPVHPKGSLRLLIVGRIHPVKGFDLLLPALAAARDEGCALDLTVAGPDEGGYEATVKRLVREHRLDDVIRFTGKLERPELAEEFARADAVIVPSHQESFGMSAAEGMASARPVVVSERVNIATEVAEADAGIVAPHSVDGIARGIVALDRQRSELRAMGERGRAYVVDTYAPEAVATAMVERYRELMDRRRRWQQAAQ